jgi:exosortase A
MSTVMNDSVDVVEPPAVPAAAPAQVVPLRPPSTPPRWWPTGTALLLLLGAILLLYRDTAVEMVAIWHRSETFAHAFLVPPIVLWLVWRQRAALAAQTPRPTAWPLLPMAVFALAWWAGDLANLNSVTQFSMTALLVLATVAVIGTQASRTIVFPLAFLFFAVPMGEVFVPQLMEWTANFTVSALRLSGIPVYRDGFNFMIPSGAWSVVEACSGVRYLIASFMVGTLFAYLNYRTMRRRLTFMGVALLVPIVANWVRAYLIVLLGHLSGNKLAAGVDHLIYGWVFFGVVILLMFWIGAKWSEHEDDLATTPAAPADAAIGSPARPAGAAQRWLIVAAAAVLAAAPHAAGRLLHGTPSNPPRLEAPGVLADSWTVVADAPIDFKPAYVNAAAELNRVYTNGTEQVGLYIGYYRQQEQGRKLVGSANALVRMDDPAWIARDTAIRSVDASGKPQAWRTTVLRARQSDGRNAAIWQVYWVNGRFTPDELTARAEIAWGKLLGRGDDAAVVMLYAPATDTDATLEAFARANLAPIEALLQKTRDSR